MNKSTETQGEKPAGEPSSGIVKIRQAAANAERVEIPPSMHLEVLYSQKRVFLQIWRGFDRETKASFLRLVADEDQGLGSSECKIR